MKFDKYAFGNVKDFKTLIVPIGSAEDYRSQLSEIRVKAAVREQDTPEETKQEQTIESADTNNLNVINMKEEAEFVPKKTSNSLQNSQSGGENRKVLLCLWGEGMRIDVLDSAGDVMDCFNALREGELYEIKINDDGEWREISKDELGPSLGKYDDEDTDHNEDFTWNAGYIEDPEEEYEDVEHINWVQTKVYGDVEIEVPIDEPLDLKKIRLMWGEIVLPNSEEPVYCGVFYDGKQYPIELDIDTEREISVEEIWSC